MPSDYLGSISLATGGIICFWFAVKTLRDDCLSPRPQSGRYRFIRRSDQPVKFWTTVAIMLINGLALIALAIYLFVRPKT